MIWATTWQNQQNECAPSKDSDQPEHPSSLIRVFAVHSMEAKGPVFTVHSMEAKGPSFLHADSEDSDQTWQMPRLIWVLDGRTLILLVMSCHGILIVLFQKNLNYKYEMRNEMSHNMTKPVNAICKQQRCRSACTSAQFDQRLNCLLP